MDAIVQWLTGSSLGEMLYTALMAMAPVVELRGAIPLGVALGLPLWTSFWAAVIGNCLPVPFIIVYTRRVFAFIRRKFPKFNFLVDKLEKKAHLKSDTVIRYGFIGLCVLVAIPLPGTGAWTGSMVAALLDMRLRKAVPAIMLGVVIAGLIVLLLTYGVTVMLF